MRIALHLRKYAYLNKLKWELIKIEIRSMGIPYAKNKAKNVRNLEGQLESCIESVEGKINSSADDSTGTTQQEYEHAKTELCCIYDERADSAILPFKVRWIESCEKPLKYFFNMKRKNYNKKTITKLTVAGGAENSNDDDILDFYENLYSSLTRNGK